MKMSFKVVINRNNDTMRNVLNNVLQPQPCIGRGDWGTCEFICTAEQFGRVSSAFHKVGLLDQMFDIEVDIKHHHVFNVL